MRLEAVAATMAVGIGDFISRHMGHPTLQSTAAGLKTVNPDWLKKMYPQTATPPPSVDPTTLVKQEEARKKWQATEQQIADIQKQIEVAGESGYEKMNVLLGRRQELLVDLTFSMSDEARQQKDLVDLAQNELDIKNAQVAADREKRDLNRQLASLEGEKSDLLARQKYTMIHTITPYLPTVEQMAGNSELLARQYGRRGVFDMMRGSKFQKKAEELIRLQHQYAWNILHPGVNSEQFVGNQHKQIDQLKKYFTDAGFMSPDDAYKELIKNTAKTNDGINALVARMQRDGIPVTIAST